jgi:hypothetical protein
MISLRPGQDRSSISGGSGDRGLARIRTDNGNPPFRKGAKGWGTRLAGEDIHSHPSRCDCDEWGTRSFEVGRGRRFVLRTKAHLSRDEAAAKMGHPAAV